ncbi:hypothetical protein ACFL6U_15725 [Planctomycetota bacterium]
MTPQEKPLRRWANAWVIVLICLLSIETKAAQKTIPIVVSVEVADTVLAPWTPTQRLQTKAKMLELFEKAAAHYLDTWWEIQVNHRMETKLTLALVFAKGGPQEHYFEVDLRIVRQWADALPTEDTRILESQPWQDPVAADTPPTTPKNVISALAAFLKSKFPNDITRKRALLLDVLDYTPVAVAAQPLGNGTNAVWLPIPKTRRWMCYQYRLFKLQSSDLYRGLPPLMVKANGVWQPIDPNTPEGLIATVEAASTHPNASDYDQAHVYLSSEDSGWNTIF